MILKASRRAGAKQLAEHLLNGEQNEHVHVHEVRGFMSDDLKPALNELYAHAQGNKRIKKFMFSMSVNPPKGETATQADIIEAIDKAEPLLGLQGQPRAIVFHEKQGRRHAHVVWSRVDENLKAIKEDYFKERLTELSKELYLKHGWTMPRGLVNKEERKTSYSLAEWQQAKRQQLNPKEVKAKLQTLWQGADTQDDFKQALSEHGYQLAKGDKVSFMLVDMHGEVKALHRTLSAKVKDIKARLGEPDDLPSVDEAKATITQEQKEQLEYLQEELEQRHMAQLAPVHAEIKTLAASQREERKELETFHAKRQQQECSARQAQYQKGLKGLWHFIIGRYHKLQQRHEEEYKANFERDMKEKETLIQSQLKARQPLQNKLEHLHQKHQSERLEMRSQLSPDIRHENTNQIQPSLAPLNGLDWD